jgi:uncharacterized protein YndB with AHSA1/START domain
VVAAVGSGEIETVACGCDTTRHVYRVYIHATPNAVWDAIVDPDLTERYGYRIRCAYDLQAGGAYMGFPSGDMKALGLPNAIVDGEILEAEAPRRFVQTWRMLVTPELASEGFTRVTWEIDGGRFGVTRLTLTHELEGAPNVAQLMSGAREDKGGGGGWNWVLSGLKTFVETGVSRSPTMQRVYQSMAAVSSIRVHRSVIGSTPNTSRRVVSRITYSPGRVGCSFP